MPTPTVTISILNYQRRETLRLALEAALGQRYPRLEVLVVDNASTDGSDRLVEQEFPGVRLIRLHENIGCAARNAGVAAAKGEIVVTLDNDVLLDDPDAVSRRTEVVARHPSAGCVNFLILDAEGRLSLRDWCHPRDWRGFAERQFFTHYVLEGASAFRRDAFERLGGYWAPLFIGHEGVDLALRMLDAGYDLLYTPDVKVRHLVSPEARPSSRIFYTFTRNAIWIAARHHRASTALRVIALDIGLMGFSALRAGHSKSFLLGLRDGLGGLRQALATRRRLRPETYSRLREVTRLRPSVVQRVRRHWKERPI
jgi:GT2 family glycosyltransferase